MVRLISLSVAISLFALQAMAGGWTQKKGEGYFKLSEWWTIADQHYTDAGKIDPNVTTGIFNTSLYGEYGISDRLTAQLYFPFISRTYMNNLVSATTGDILSKGEAITRIGDTDIGVKYGLLPNSKIPVAATLILGLPIGEDQGGSQNNLQTGDGEFNQMVQLDAGFPLLSKDWGSLYGNLLVGFNNRTNDFSDEFRYGAEAGIGVLQQKLWIIGKLYGLESLKNGKLASEITSTSVFANNTEFTTFSVEGAYYILKNLGVSFNYTTALRGEIILANPSYSAGVFWHLR